MIVLGECEICGRDAEKHHIVFKSQGGLDFELNYKKLCFEHHKGNDGPHNCRKTDLKYKIELQRKLQDLLTKKYYTEEEIRELIDLNKKQADKIFKRFMLYSEGYDKDEIIRRLMGGRLYE